MLPWAALSVLAVVGWRSMVFRRKFAPSQGWDVAALRTTLPNLSMVAVGVQALRNSEASEAAIDWLLLSGLMLSLIPVFWHGRRMAPAARGT